MQLQMKAACEKCAVALRPDGEAYICSYECTFCSDCAARARMSCPHCGGELVNRPKRKGVAGHTSQRSNNENPGIRPLLVWAVSLSAWALIILAAAVSLKEYYRSTGSPETFLHILSRQSYQMIPYALLTPFVFSLALRYPIRGVNWVRRSLLHVILGLIFILFQVALRGITPYAAWDPRSGGWVSAVIDPQTHAVAIQWHMLKGMFLASAVDDFMFTYVPILLVAHVISYYRGFREGAFRASQLEAQLAKAHLQSLKSQLQPHFLFNTLHSISALILTNPGAADRMLTRLGELLRMSLEDGGVQLTSFSRELDFVNGYLEIEKVRFEDRLEVILDISPDTLDAQVPHSLLQPLVENAVRHGVSRRSTPVTLRIIARRDSHGLHLLVNDDGPGLPGSFGEERKGGLGLKATRERLETLYGNNQHMEIRNVPEGGVEVSIRIPFSLSSAASEPGATDRKEDVPVEESMALRDELPPARPE